MAQQPFQQQGGQPNYSALLRSIAGMFGQQGGAPVSNYNPVQSANDFQLRNTYQFNPATDPSRQLADRMWAENHQRELDEKAAREARAARGESYGYGMGDSTGGAGGSGGGGGGAPGEAGGPGGDSSGGDPSGEGGLSRGGHVSPDKKIRAALLTAKGVQAKAIGGGSFSGPKYPDVEKLAQAHDKFIYHSGTVDDLNNMKWGLEPQHGPWIQELANHAGDMEPEEILDRATPLVWFSDSPSWVAAKVSRKLDKHVNDVTEDEIRQHGHVAIVPRKGDHAKHIYHVGEEGLNNGAYSSVKDLTGKTKKAYETELYDDNKEPFGVERNEYVSAKEVEPLLHLTGDHLVNFLRAVKRRGQPVGKSGGGALAAPGALVEEEPQPQFSVSNPMPVFPKPQRMWDDQRPGGAYLSMPDKADVTGHRAAQAEIGVKPGGKPFFNASRDAVEATGTPGRGSAIVKTNLFKKKAGWQWAQAPEGHEATDTIVSVDHRGKHHYALNVQFPKGVDLSRYEKATSEPRLRPTTKGNLEFGEQAGTILVRGKEHPVYHNVIVRNSGGRVGYAGGGGEDDPTVQKALGLTQQAMPAVQPEQSPISGAMQVAQAVTSPGRKRFEIAPARVAPMTIDQKDRDLPEEGGVTIKRLTDAFKRAIDNHLSLPPAQQIANARQAENNVAKYVGRGKEGKMNSVLTANKKLMKAQTAGENNTPLTLPDGRTLEMTGLALMPDYREGQFKMCGNSDVCRDLCLGKESGQYRYDKTATQTQIPTTKEEVAEAGNKPRMSAFRRTMAMMRDPESFAVYLHELIDGAKIMAERRGSHLGVRLNVLSDLSPKIMEPIIKAHPEVSFYDYTKMNYDPVAPNHHYTYSSTGLSQPERGIENPFSNWRKLRDRLDQGHNVAMAFAHGKGDAFPEHLHDEETGKKYRVVSGDDHDFRPMDMVPEGEDGVIVALKNMAASNSEYKYENATRNSHGFFVHHEPNFERTAKGTFVRDENGKRIPQSKIYNVPIQPMKRGAMRQKED
jgi:hypothetical protein